MDGIGLSEWTPDSRKMPIVRVGIVLTEDQDKEIRIQLPEEGYTALAGGADEAVAIAKGKHSLLLKGDKVELACEGQETRSAPWWQILPPQTHGDGPLADVENVVAGRGFHWETRILVSLPDVLDIRPCGENLQLVNILPIEKYLKGVITAEMSGECPIDLLKSQCVTARAWMLARTERKHDMVGFDYCNDDCCQRYQGLGHLTEASSKAVDETAGEVMRYSDGTIIDANYSKSCGGIVEAPEPVWGFEKKGQYAVPDGPHDSPLRRFLPVTDKNIDEYLDGDWLATTDAFCSPAVAPEQDLPKYLGHVDDGGGHFRWSVQYSREELEGILRRKFFEREGINGDDALGQLQNLVVRKRGTSGRAISVSIEYMNPAGQPRKQTLNDQYWIRHGLCESFLYSSAFRVMVEKDDQGNPALFRFDGAGWGHGAGLCQIGALGMALTGHDYRAICHHYFEKMTLEVLY